MGLFKSTLKPSRFKSPRLLPLRFVLGLLGRCLTQLTSNSAKDDKSFFFRPLCQTGFIQIWLAVFSILFVLTSLANAQSFPHSQVPEELKPWIPWVLFEEPTYACPITNGHTQCLWPGTLNIELTNTEGAFTLRATADVATWISLPGNADHWPQQVTLNSNPAVVLSQDHIPIVHLSAGNHTLSGKWSWDKMPEGIPIPNEIGIVSFIINGKPMAFPKRDPNGMCWIRDLDSDDTPEEELNITVMRKIADGIPLSINSQFVIRASGKSREVVLEQALLNNTVPLLVTSDIPVRVDRNGNVRLQVRPGTHTVSVVARGEGNVASIDAIERPAPLPNDEIWVWQGDESLRQVSLLGLPSIDPSRTSLPKSWHKYPSFIATPKSALQIKTLRRGQPVSAPNQINLNRHLWMDLDGKGYTISDTLTGTLNQTWRLDLKPGTLGHVAVNNVDQLITKNPKTGQSGVEIRNNDLSVTADWRLPNSTSRLPAVGWSQDVQNLNTTLHLPPGWELISASGVDELPNTYWDNWNLFGFFFVLVVALAIGKLTRWFYGIIALLTLLLTYQEPDAPFIVWIGMLITLALLKVLPKGKLRIGGVALWWVCVIWLVGIVIPFTVNQIREGLYPQVARGYTEPHRPKKDNNLSLPRTKEEDISALQSNIAQVSEKADSEANEELNDQMVKELSQLGYLQGAENNIPVQQQVMGKMGSRKRTKDSWSSSYGIAKQAALQQDPKTVVQTGPGLPAWQWNSWQLNWSGPVDKAHQIKLYMISPTVNLILAILRVLLLFGLAIRLVWEGRASGGTFGDLSLSSIPKSGGVAVGILLFTLLSQQSPTAFAQPIPDEQLRTELHSKLTQDAECRPNCVENPQMSLSVTDNTLTISSEVHVGAPSSWPIPGPIKNWVPTSVVIDGKPTTSLRAGDDQFLHVRLDSGTHTVVASGPLPEGNGLLLECQHIPRYVTADAASWEVDGIREDGHTDGSIQLIRKSRTPTDDKGKNDFEEGVYPPWLEITRTLDLGIPWLVHTTVKRISPIGTPVIVRIPLLNGESVTDAAVQVDDNHAAVSLSRSDKTISWTSTLEEHGTINLKASQNKPWNEIWKIQCSPIWRCSHSGLAPIKTISDNMAEPFFRPWPGESVKLSIIRPEGIQGQTTTIDSVRTNIYPGIRLEKGDITLSVRSSSGGVQTITLPPNATVQEMTINDEKQPFRTKGDTVSVSLKPGKQRIRIAWQTAGGISSFFKTPVIDVGGRASNITTVVHLPKDRWLLLVGGPSWGPAVLFWGFLLTILLAGLVLGKVPLSPMKSWQWMLLALGLTQIPIAGALIIVLWFFALSKRGTAPPQHFVLHNIVQIALGIWTLVALICLIGAVYQGLAVQPDMQISGAGSTDNRLIWYMDSISNHTPAPWILSVPILFWRIIMLGWALWLAATMVNWAKWAWKSWSAQSIWKSTPPRAASPSSKSNP